jgi:DASS family divalent anion:Na+ symporter
MAALGYLDIPLFSGLLRVDVARLVPELEEITVAAGEVVMHQGDPGDALYVVREGRVRAELADGDRVTVLVTFGPGSAIGEIALLTDRPHLATVRAIERTTLWRLSRERFNALILKHPSLALYFHSAIGPTLMTGLEQTIERQRALAVLSRLAWAGLAPATAEFVLRAAPLLALTAAAREALDPDSPAAGAAGGPLDADLQRLGAVATDADGRLRLPPPLRDLGARQFVDRHGPAAYREWARGLADRCARQGDSGNAVEAYLVAEAWADAGRRLTADEAALRAEGGAEQWAVWQARLAAGAGPASAAAASAVTAGPSGVPPPASADLSPASAPELPGRAASAAHGRSTARGPSRAGSTVLRRWLGEPGRSPHTWLRPLGAALGLSAGLAVWLELPALGISPEAGKLLAILAAASVFWLLDVAPQFVTALTACVAALLAGVAPANVVFSGFSNSSVFLLLVILGLSALVTESGLSLRIAIWGMRLFPATYVGQVWALGCTGLVASTLVPGTLSRLMMIGPLVVAIKDTLRTPDGGRAAAGLSLGAYVGYGQMSFLFLNGTPACFVILGLLPVAVARQITWTSWLLAALPLGVVVFVGMMLTVLWRFRAEDAAVADRRVLAAELATLGPVRYQEWLSLLGLALLFASFALGPWLDVDAGWLALPALAVLFALGVDRRMFQTVDYQSLLYFAGFLSLANVTRAAGVDALLTGVVRPYLAVFEGSPYLLLGTLTVLAYLLMAFLPWLPSHLMLMIALIPLADSLGYNPFVFGLVMLVTLMPGIAPNLGTAHQLYRVATEERTFTFGHVRELAVFQAGIIVLGVLCSIPYWQWLGLVPR